MKFTLSSHGNVVQTKGANQINKEKIVKVVKTVLDVVVRSEERERQTAIIY